MNTNWIIIGIVVIFCLVVVYFLIKLNLKDEREYEEFLTKNDETQFLHTPERDDL
jgi:hypothetical protein